jgi:hypothetical protein
MMDWLFVKEMDQESVVCFRGDNGGGAAAKVGAYVGSWYICYAARPNLKISE